MLQKLSIKNYAIIEDLDITLSDQLTIITGETGAGKSIMLGALALILGQRADTSVLLDKEKKCIIEGSFNIKNYRLKELFEREDLDYDQHSIIRREIAPSGKSRAFVNDTPVTLAVLKELTDQLVDLHAQHETLELSSEIFQIKAIDAIAGNQKSLDIYQDIYKTFTTEKKKLNALIEEQNKVEQDLEYFQFQLNELEEASLEEIDQDKLEEDLKRLNNAEEIKSKLSQISGALSQSDLSIAGALNEVSSQLKSAAKLDSSLASLSERLDKSYIEISDIATDIDRLEQETIYDEQLIDELNNRLDTLYRLQKKHSASTVQDLINIREEIRSKVNGAASSSEEIEQLKEIIKDLNAEVLILAQELSKNRGQNAPKLASAVNELLHDVGMPHAQLKVDQSSDESRLTSSGIDKVQFLFSANKGGDFKPLHKVASGGELSRLMLALKSQIASSTALPTLVFDEIDTGISGEVALKVGKILNTLSKAHQVVCITHLPQIASKGNQHYFVYKDDSKNHTNTKVKLLGEEERIVELAKMLSGEQPTEAAINNAKELISLS